MKYYVYELIDPRDKAVFYVGKGCGNRVDQHEREARAGRVSRKCDRIREIEAAGLSIAKKIVKRFADEVGAYLFEEDRVAFYGLSKLTNVVPGGGSPRGVTATSEDRMRVRVAAEMIARCGYGKIAAIKIFGDTLDLIAIIEGFKRGVAKVIERRGLEWVNAIARKFRVEFVVAPAV